VTIRAQQEALANLGTKTLNTSGHSILGDTELLQGRVEMMELQRRNTAVVAAEPAASPRLLDEDLLDSSATPHHGFLAAPAATEIPTGVSDVVTLPVPGTHQRRLRQAGFASRAGRIRRAAAHTTPGP
jgi:hypothetical protein